MCILYFLIKTKTLKNFLLFENVKRDFKLIYICTNLIYSVVKRTLQSLFEESQIFISTVSACTHALDFS